MRAATAGSLRQNLRRSVSSSFVSLSSRPKAARANAISSMWLASGRRARRGSLSYWPRPAIIIAVTPADLRKGTRMSWSLNIGKVAGKVIRNHLTFLLFLAWIFAASYASNGKAAAFDGLAFMVLLFLCVLLHEFGHIFTARAFGVATPYVTLLPIGGVAQLERIPEEPWEEFLIAIAGPLVNIAIAIILVLAFGAALQPSAASAVDNMAIPLVNRLAAVNVFLALCNLIPAFPMDGGRVLRALLASRFGVVRATEIAASVGQFVAFALGFIGLLYIPILIFIAIFDYLAATSICARGTRLAKRVIIALV